MFDLSIIRSICTKEKSGTNCDCSALIKATGHKKQRDALGGQRGGLWAAVSLAWMGEGRMVGSREEHGRGLGREWKGRHWGRGPQWGKRVARAPEIRWNLPPQVSRRAGELALGAAQCETQYPVPC